MNYKSTKVVGGWPLP